MSKAADNLRASLGLPTGDMHQIPDLDTPLGEGEDHNPDPRPPAQLTIQEKKTVVTSEQLDQSDVAIDYVFARNLTYTMLQLIGDQMAGAAKVAQDTEHPRAYGVFNELAGTMRSVVQDLLGLQKAFKDIKRDDTVLQPPTVNVNVGAGVQADVFTDGTANILRIIEQHTPASPTLDIGDAEIDEVPIKAERVVDGKAG